MFTLRGDKAAAPVALSAGDKATVIVPGEKRSPQALRSRIEEFVTREGSDSGYPQKSLDENMDMGIRQLRRGEAFNVYDKHTQSANIVSKTPILGDVLNLVELVFLVLLQIS